MRLTLIIFCALLVPNRGLCQQTNPAKIHIYCSGFDATLYSVLDPNTPITFSGKGSYTVLEIALNTLQVQLKLGGKKNRVVSIPVEQGTSYYYQLSTTKETPITLKELPERDFFLLVAFLAYRYQHYSLTNESGVKLVEE